jgi:glycosyltransferase involved in cell wall biosynthesis
VHGHEVGGTNPALLQALGCGACALVLDVPFNAEVVQEAALLYRRDPDDLAVQMRRLLAEPQLVGRLRERAQRRVLEAYQWEDVVEGYERVLRRVVDGTYRAAPQPDAAYPAAAAVARSPGQASA